MKLTPLQVAVAAAIVIALSIADQGFAQTVNFGKAEGVATGVLGGRTDDTEPPSPVVIGAAWTAVPHVGETTDERQTDLLTRRTDTDSGHRIREGRGRTCPHSPAGNR